MPLSKKCPQCSVVVHVRKLVCVCGYTFVRNHVVARYSKRLAMRCVREAESEVELSLRNALDKERKFRKRALETEGETEDRRKQAKGKKRALETEGETEERRKQAKVYEGNKRAL